MPVRKNTTYQQQLHSRYSKVQSVKIDVMNRAQNFYLPAIPIPCWIKHLGNLQICQRHVQICPKKRINTTKGCGIQCLLKSGQHFWMKNPEKKSKGPYNLVRAWMRNLACIKNICASIGQWNQSWASDKNVKKAVSSRVQRQCSVQALRKFAHPKNW